MLYDSTWVEDMPAGNGFRHIGLARALSKLGYCSRSHACDLIKEGRVALNGATQYDPEYPVGMDRTHTPNCILKVDGKRVLAARKAYLMLNKPRGYVATASDEKGRSTIYDLLEADLPWLGPVGRLDKASEGLLLLTNDSEWAARVLAPETHLEKTYHVQVRGVLHDETRLLPALLKGKREENGKLLRVKQASILRHGGQNTWLEIVLDEGKNRHIRRLLESFQIEVLRLVRTAIGPLALGELRKGTARSLSFVEKKQLDTAMGSMR